MSIELVIDGVRTPVAAFCATADSRQEAAGVYRLDFVRANGLAGRWWALATGVQQYELIAPCGGSYPW